MIREENWQPDFIREAIWAYESFMSEALAEEEQEAELVKMLSNEQYWLDYFKNTEYYEGNNVDYSDVAYHIFVDGVDDYANTVCDPYYWLRQACTTPIEDMPYG